MSVFTNPASSSKEQAAAYTAAILGLLGETDPMSVLESTPARVKESISGLSKAELTRPEAPSKWNIAAVVRHLADSDVVLGWRLRMVLAHDRPEITGYDQDAWADRLRYMQADAHEALEEFEALRRGNVRLFRQCSADELERYGVHNERGKESVAHMTKMYAGHDLLHLRQIARIRGVA